MPAATAKKQKRSTSRKRAITKPIFQIEHYYPGHPYIEKIIEKAALCDNVVIDGFCGWGGVTHGFKKVPNFFVIACINHWETAIRQHFANNPDCLHLLEDFRTADLSLIKYMLGRIRVLNPNVRVHGWFSLECTNFSQAKGGMSREADSRTLADHVDRYLITLDIDIMWIENVKEFRWWGPMIAKVSYLDRKKKKHNVVIRDASDTQIILEHQRRKQYLFCPLVIKKNKSRKPKDWTLEAWNIPDPVTKGQDYRRWMEHIKSLGYDSYEQMVNMADYGVPQHRIRLIMQFPKKGILPVYPQATHDRQGKGGLQRWIPIKTCLDLSDEGQSVLSFHRNKKGKLVPRIKSKKTIDRLIKGCLRHPVREYKTQFVSQANNGFMSDSQDISLESASRTLNCTGGNMQVVTAQMINQYYGEGGAQTGSIDSPAPAIPTKDRVFLVTQRHIDQQYGGQGENYKSAEDVSGTLMPTPKQNLVTTTFMEHRYSSGQTDKSAEEPAGAITGNPKQTMVTVKHILDTQYGNVGHSIEETAKTITANRKHYYLVSTQYNNPAKSIEEVSATLIARMDKKPPYLVVTEFGQLAIEVYKTDPPHLVRLKKFMAENGIISICMRALNRKELKRIQTLDENSIDLGGETDQKKMIGNAVPSLYVQRLAECYDNARRSTEQKIA